jgi:hypothetical protein
VIDTCSREEVDDFRQDRRANEEDGLTEVSDPVSLDESRIAVLPASGFHPVTIHEPLEAMRSPPIRAVDIPGHQEA